MNGGSWPIVSVQDRAVKLPMGAMGSTANLQRLPRAFGIACLLVQLSGVARKPIIQRALPTSGASATMWA